MNGNITTTGSASSSELLRGTTWTVTMTDGAIGILTDPDIMIGGATGTFIGSDDRRK
jgi:hypothetical protein